jgi:hypothetical protein
MSVWKESECERERERETEDEDEEQRTHHDRTRLDDAGQISTHLRDCSVIYEGCNVIIVGGCVSLHL